jgi:hypothetical protein
MDTNEKKFDPEHEEFIARLTRVPAASVPLDPQVVFYQAGYAAARAQNRIQLWRMGTIATAASMAGLCLVAALAYRAGSNIASRSRDSQVSVAANVSDESLDSTQSTQTQSNSSSNSPDAIVPDTIVLGATSEDFELSNSWWAAWLPTELRPIAYTNRELLQSEERISLIGLSSQRKQLINSRDTGSGPSETRSEIDVSHPLRFSSPAPLHPHDWKSLLPTL